MSLSLILTAIILTIIISVFLFFIFNYSTLKNKNTKFHFKSVAAQLLAITVWISLLSNIFLPKNYLQDNTGIGIIIFGISLIVGVLLIRSIFREIETEKDVEILIGKLHKNNVNLKKLDDQKTEFVSLASHQLRGPLANINGYSSMLLEEDYGKIPKELHEPINRIFQSSTFLGFLINDFLDITRIEKGEIKYNLEDFDLSKLLFDVYKEFEISAKSAELDLIKDFNEKEKMMVRSDLEKTRQVFSNLIDNAIKYTKKGSVRITCIKKGKFARIKIKDTGIGISESTKPKLFKKFSRGEGAVKVNTTGSGLGLFIASTMISGVGGKMWAESEGENKGSAFFVEIPLAK